MNQRYNSLLIAIALLAVVAMYFVAHMVERGFSTSATIITGFAALFIFELLKDLRAQGRTARLEGKVDAAAGKAETAKNVAVETKEVIDQIKIQTNGGLKVALETPVPAQAAMPKTPDEVEAFVETIVKKTLEEQRKRDAEVEQ